MTPPRELMPLLGNSFPAFSELLGHIRYFYVADEIWDGKTSLIFCKDGDQMASIELKNGSYNVHITDETFQIADESQLAAVFDTLSRAAQNHRRPEAQLSINPKTFPCGYRCDMCILIKRNEKPGRSANEGFAYLDWLCYHGCLEKHAVERKADFEHACPGCEAVRKSNPRYCRYVNCANERGHNNCVECGGHNTCDEMKDSHHPGQCNLGLTANEVTKMIVPYNMKWRLDMWTGSR